MVGWRKALAIGRMNREEFMVGTAKGGALASSGRGANGKQLVSFERLTYGWEIARPGEMELDGLR